MSEAVLFDLRNIHKEFTKGKEKITIFDNLSLTIKKGDFVAIMGPSGSGKTTLLNMLGGVDRPTRGEILFNGSDITRLGESQLAKWRADHVGFIFQFYHLWVEGVDTVRHRIEGQLRWPGRYFVYYRQSKQ